MSQAGDKIQLDRVKSGATGYYKPLFKSGSGGGDLKFLGGLPSLRKFQVSAEALHCCP